MKLTEKIVAAHQPSKVAKAIRCGCGWRGSTVNAYADHLSRAAVELALDDALDVLRGAAKTNSLSYAALAYRLEGVLT